MWLAWTFLVLSLVTWTDAEGTAHSRRRLAAKPTVLSKPDYSIYLKKDALLDMVKDRVKAFPDIAKVLTVSTSGLQADASKKARLLLDFGEHGREFISSELGLRLLSLLTDPAELQEFVGSTAQYQRVSRILDAIVFKILPMENVNGRSKVEAGDLCERKNGRGVDTNRNWDIDWGKKEKDYNPYEEFPGKEPFSEPEVKIIKGLAESFKPHMWLNIHSGMEAMFTPYDHRAVVPEGPLPRASLRLLEVVNKHIFEGKCVVGSGGKSVGYLAHGTATDYMFEKMLVPMSYTWEIYGDFDAHFDDCFRMFNPLTKDIFEAVLTKWLQALLMLLELLPLHPAVGGLMLPSLGEQGVNSTLRESMLEGGDVTIATLPVVASQPPVAAVQATTNTSSGVSDLTTLTFKAAGGNPLLLALALVGFAAIAVIGFRYALAGRAGAGAANNRQGARRPTSRKPSPV